MKLAQICALTGALLLSSAALAEDGADRTSTRMMAANNHAMEKFVAKEGSGDPVASNDVKDEKTKEM